MEDVKWVVRRVLTHWHLILLALFGSLLEGIGTSGISLLMKSLSEALLQKKNTGQVLGAVGLLLVFVFLAQIGSFFVRFFTSLYAEREMLRIRSEVFNVLLNGDFSNTLKQSSGDFISNLIYDLGLIRNLLGLWVIKLLREPIVIIALLGVLIYRDAIFTLFLLLSLPVIVLSVSFFGEKRSRSLKKSQTAYSEISQRVFSAFSGFETVKSMQASKAFERFFNHLSKELQRAGFRSEFYFALNSVFNFTTGYLIVALVIVFGSYRLASNQLSAGEFVSFLMALVLLQMPLMEFQKGLLELRSNMPAIQRVRRVLSLQPERKDGIILSSSPLDFEITSLSVNLENLAALKDISLKIPYSDHLIVLGETGSGKSTLLRVLSGLLPYRGSVLIGGLELSSVLLSDLRSRVFLVPQEPFVFDGTLRENLTLGEDFDSIEIVKATKLAKCDFLGLEDRLKPSELSGGEKQRIALARIFLKNPDVLLLDEATSALDEKTQEEILLNIIKAFEKKTIIAVAHRLSLLRYFKRAIVLRNGRLIYDGDVEGAASALLDRPKTAIQ
ncbi:MAG: ABC transporter ATP-binding protein [Aquificaceae bacterium]